MARRFRLVLARDGSHVHSVSTWGECKPFFKHLYDKPRLTTQYRLEDTETGRVWEPGDAYEWEAART